MDEIQLLEEKKAAITKKPVSNIIFTEAQAPLRWSAFKNNEPQAMFDLFTKPAVNNLSVFEHKKKVGDASGVFAKYMRALPV